MLGLEKDCHRQWLSVVNPQKWQLQGPTLPTVVADELPLALF